jgi:hypothetical protein
MRIFHSHGLQAGLPKNAGQKKSTGESNFGAESNRRRRNFVRVCRQTFNQRRPQRQPSKPNQSDKATSPASEMTPAFGWRARH